MGATRFGSVHCGEAPGLVDLGSPSTEATAGAVTFTATQVLSKLILRDPNGAARADLLPTAAAIIAALTAFIGSAPEVGSFFDVHVRNTADAAETITITTNTGLTLSGTMTIAQNASRVLRFVVTSGSAVTVYSVGAYTH